METTEVLTKKNKTCKLEKQGPRYKNQNHKNQLKSEAYNLYISSSIVGVNKKSLKRMIDVLISVTAIIFILSWLLPILGIIIMIETKGSMFFIQKRSGLYNRPFNCYKLRTMTAHKDANTFHTTPNQYHITRIGAFLRKTNLDELPQFLNVLLGSMSLVGPRPHMLAHDEYYSQQVKNYNLRYSIKPGITGLAQINGYRGDIKSKWHMEKRLEHDLIYVKKFSIWMDIKIMIQTLFFKKGYVNAK